MSIIDNLITEESFYDEFYLSYIFEPDEISNKKYDIVLCEPYNNFIHGNSLLNNHFLVDYRFKKYDFTIFKILKNNLLRSILDNYRNSTHKTISHMSIRNYKVLLNKLKPEIAECNILADGECICILKTYWIRIIQRKWKSIFKKRNEIIKKMSCVNSIKYREINGRWPNYIENIPYLKGMLNAYSRIRRVITPA
jgi:hypothetical protein